MAGIGHDCGCGCGCGDQAGFPSDPTTAINYHFGMLLGVEDLRAEQGFHVGRVQRHQREAHGAGVLRGLEVKFDEDDNEIKVMPGFAVDRLGRDIEIDRPHCFSLPAWFSANAPKNPDLRDANAAGGFSLLITLQAAACLERPVQAIAAECNGSGQEVAFSRLRETFHLGIEFAPAPPAAEAPSVLSQIIDMATAGTLPDDAADPQKHRLHLLWQQAYASGSGTDLALFLKQALILDQLARQPQEPDADPDDGVFPIAWIDGITVLPGEMEGSWTVAVGLVDLTVRPVLMPTVLVQEQALALDRTLLAQVNTGPQVVSAALSADRTTISAVFDRALDERSVQPAAFGLSVLTAQGFQPVAFPPPTWDETTKTVTLDVPAMPAGALRLVMRGTGDAPLVGLDHSPLGRRGQGDGRDYATTF